MDSVSAGKSALAEASRLYENTRSRSGQRPTASGTDPGGKERCHEEGDQEQAPARITRREFVGGLAAAGIVTGAPALLRGRNLNDKLNIAFIGCGGRGLTNINELTIRPPGPPARLAQAVAATPLPRPRRIRTRTWSCSVTSIRTPLTPRPSVSAGCEGHRPPARLRQARRLRRGRRLDGRAHARLCDLSGPDARQARLLRKAAHLQHLGSPPHSRDRCQLPEAVDADGQSGSRVVARRTIKEILMTGVIGPVREVHVWADRAWGLQDFESADSTTGRTGSTKTSRSSIGSRKRCRSRRP